MTLAFRVDGKELARVARHGAAVPVSASDMTGYLLKITHACGALYARGEDGLSARVLFALESATGEGSFVLPLTSLRPLGAHAKETVVFTAREGGRVSYRAGAATFHLELARARTIAPAPTLSESAPCGRAAGGVLAHALGLARSMMGASGSSGAVGLSVQNDREGFRARASAGPLAFHADAMMPGPPWSGERPTDLAITPAQARALERFWDGAATLVTVGTTATHLLFSNPDGTTMLAFPRLAPAMADRSPPECKASALVDATAIRQTLAHLRAGGFPTMGLRLSASELQVGSSDGSGRVVGQELEVDTEPEPAFPLLGADVPVALGAAIFAGLRAPRARLLVHHPPGSGRLTSLTTREERILHPSGRALRESDAEEEAVSLSVKRSLSL